MKPPATPVPKPTFVPPPTPRVPFGLKFDRRRPLAALDALLASQAEPGYGAYIAKSLPGTRDEVIGIRIPILRAIAKEISTNFGADFLEAVLFDGKTPLAKRLKSCETKMTVGFVLGTAKIDFDERLAGVRALLPTVDSWMVCDELVAAIKVPISRQEEYWAFLDELAESPSPFFVRFAVVSTLYRFLSESWLDRIFDRVDRIASRSLNEYYVDMALAWLLSIAFIEFPNRTRRYLDECDLNASIVDRALRKIVESNSKRIDDETRAAIQREREERRQAARSAR